MVRAEWTDKHGSVSCVLGLLVDLRLSQVTSATDLHRDNTTITGMYQRLSLCTSDDGNDDTVPTSETVVVDIEL